MLKQRNLSSTKKKQLDNILKQAERCFVKYGIAHTTMSDIAKEADVYRRTLYNYFDSKEEIASEIFSRYAEQDIIVGFPEHVSGLEKFRLLMDFLVKQISQFKPYIFFAVQYEHYFHFIDQGDTHFKEGMNLHMVQLLESILKEGLTDNSIRLPDGNFDMIVQSVLQTILAYVLRVVYREHIFKIESGFSLEHLGYSLQIITRGIANET